MTVQSRTALVTGAASGIGLATVEILLAQGWRVAGLDRDAKAIAAAREQLEPHAGRFRFDIADVTDEAAVTGAAARVQRDFGPLRGVFTSAGIARNTGFFETTADHFRAIHEVNVIGTFLVAKACAALMRDTGGGAIVTVASISGLAGNMGRAAYGATKGAVVNLTRIMAVELARHGIRANCIAPGPVETPMVKLLHAESERARWIAEVPARRYGTPAEIGEAAAFLLDNARSSFITGQILAVDGGFMAGGVLDREGV